MKKQNYIPQSQLARLKQLAAPGKAVIIYGPRRVGKTTLVKQYEADSSAEVLLVTGEDIAVREYLESQSVAKLTAFAASRQVLIIDEAQAVRNIGLNLKLLVDHLPELTIVATGSSSFALAGQTGEPLTGRKFTLLLLPLAQLELAQVEAPHETSANLETRLIYGSYPEVVLLQANEQREMYLTELVSSYLFKDILQFDGIRHSDKLLRLLQLLAFQIGHDVSVAELGTQLGMSKNTVDRYLDLLEQVFVIYSRCGFARNLRKEITKNRRYYFVDNGVRNALISNFNPLALRGDIGPLWENYVITERLKRNLYSGHTIESRFWRTYDQQEIDLVEESGGTLHAFEIKWKPRKQKPPAAWARTYPEALFSVIHPDNYLEFIL